jgi:hypothetical protein
LTTNGVGREELLKQLAGGGEVKMNKIEFRGWDVEGSTESGNPRTGISRWTSGEGEFTVGEQKLRFDTIQLVSPQSKIKLVGSISFDMNGNLTFAPSGRVKPGTHAISAARELFITGPLENPTVLVQPAAATGN